MHLLNHFVLLFWWGWWYAIYIMYCHGVSPFPAVFTTLLCYLCACRKNVLNTAHILSLADCCRQSLISLLKVDVCAKRVIHFDTTIALAIVCPPALENSCLFSSCLMMRARISMWLYGLTIFTVFPLRFIPSIDP